MDHLQQRRAEAIVGFQKTAINHPKIYLQKIILYCWWDWKAIVYYELLSRNQTINSEKYCNQLGNLKEAVAQKRPNRKGVVFHQDNTTRIFGHPTNIIKTWLGCLA